MSDDRGPTVVGATPELLAKLLDRYAAVVSQTIPNDHPSLRDGLDARSVTESLGRLGLVPPEEILTWWSWHDGPAATAPHGHRLEQLSLASAIELYRWHLSQPGGAWAPNWLPIVGDTRTSIAVDCTPATRPPLVRVVDYEYGATTDGSETRFQVESLCTVVTRWITAYERRWYVPDGAGHVRVDQALIPEPWLLSQIY